MIGGFEQGRRFIASDDSLGSSKLAPTDSLDADPFQTWVARPMSVSLSALHLVILAPVQEAMTRLSRFFTLTVESSVVDESPEEGTFTVRVFKQCSSALLKIQLYNENDNTVVTFQSLDKSLEMVSHLFQHAKVFLQKSSWADDGQPSAAADWGRSCSSTTDATQSVDDSLSVEGSSPNYDSPTPTMDDWLLMFDDGFVVGEELSSVCQIAISYQPRDLGSLAEVISPDFLNQCWKSSQAVVVIRLLKHMSHDPDVATLIVPKLDPTSLPDDNMIVSEFCHLILHLATHATSITQSVQKSLIEKLEIRAAQPARGMNAALFRQAAVALGERD